MVNRLVERCFDLVLVANFWGNGRSWIEAVPFSLRARVVVQSFNGVAEQRASLGPLGFRHFVSKVDFATQMGEVLRLCRK